MKKDIKDYLHLYLGCECLWEHMDGNSGGNDKMTEYYLNEERIGSMKLKPILRSLSDMNVIEGKEILNLVTEWHNRKSFELKFLEFAGNTAHIGVYYEIAGSPHRIGDGEYNETIIISDDTIWGRGVSDRSEFKLVLNTFKVTHYLLKQGFDLFNLIKDGLAIDKTKYENALKPTDL